ncbi:MAG TPA: DUF1343 domain-containing protein [Phycisphaerales bacterium]|nr:DUF1343 domain-containing protein [Phycisphaerales bacterium]
MYRVLYGSVLTLGLVSCAASGPVRTGLDDTAHLAELLGGKRVGVIANATARDAQGRFIVDVLRDLPQVRVTALFAPEHGLQAQLGAGDRVQDETFQGLTVHSLYGETRRPTPQMLADVDVLVFDIQDVGARFYTYASTMTLAMGAAAECGKPFIVLDRPNPINGRAVEGNLLEPAFASFVGLWPIPVRHGLTMGELARLVAGEGWLKGPRPPDLTVVPMQGWRRAMWFDQTHLVFIRPSPNIPDPDTALVYIGLCLLEGTNVSEGRGTDRPFMQFGAPWVDGQALCTRLEALHLPGLAFEPMSFTPTSSKHAGTLCHGARIIITDRDRVESYWSGIRIVQTLRTMDPEQFAFRAGHFDRLCGTDRIRKAIEADRPLEPLRRNWQAELQRFQAVRQRYLLYP